MKRPLLLILCLFSLVSQGQTPMRLALYYTDVDVKAWLYRIEHGIYVAKGDVQANSPGDWNRINANASAFRSNPAGDRYDTKVYKGTGYVPRAQNGTYDPAGCAIKLRDCAFRSLVYKNHSDGTKATQSVADATAVIAELKRIVDQTIPDGPDVGSDPDKAFDWNNTDRWRRTKPYNFQDVNPGFVLAEWLTRCLIAAESVKDRMSSGDSTKIYQWFSDAAYYMQHNYLEDANELFVNRPAGNYTVHPGTVYSLENDVNNYKIMFSTSTVVGPKAHYIRRHFANRRATMNSFVGRAGIALEDSYLIGIAKQWVIDMYRFSFDDDGNYSDFFRSITDNNTAKAHAYATLYNVWAFVDELALYGDRTLYEIPRLKPSITRLAQMRNRDVQMYASKTPTSDVSLILDGPRASTWLDLSMSIPNRFYRDTYLKQTYLRTASGSIPYPSNPAGAGPDVSAAVFGSYPAATLMFANMEGTDDRYRQAITDPGEDTTQIPPPTPPPDIVSHWVDFGDTITISAPTHFLNYTVDKVLLHGDTVGIASRYVTNHAGNDTLTLLFPSARGVDSSSAITGRDRFDAEASYVIQTLHSGSWTTQVDITGNTSTTRLHDLNVGSADGIRWIWRKDTGYTRIKEASVKISAPF